MTLVIKRRNRKTRTVIALHQETAPAMFLWESHIYWSTECRDHGLIAEWDTRKEAEHMMARSVGCCTMARCGHIAKIGRHV